MLGTTVMRLATLFRVSRSIGIGLSKLKKRPALPVHVSEDFKVNAAELLSDVRKKGFSRIFKINDRQLNDIRNYCRNTEFKNTETGEFFNIDIDNPLNPSDCLWYQDENIYTNSATVKELAHDKSLVEVAKQYLGAEPNIKSVVAWWSFPPKDTAYTPTYGYHYDIDALKFIKYFIYLVDVDEQTGPHVIISDTHKRKSFFEKKNRRLKDEQVTSLFNKDRIHVITGKAGSAFFEDTFSYHKGTTPQKPRLMLQVEYSI
jgi:hypothetical protein